MKLFRDMTESEAINSKRSLIFGFYVFLFLLGINNLYYFITAEDLLSSFTIFTAGLVLTFGYEFYLNTRQKPDS